MRLSALLSPECIALEADVEVARLVLDSRQLQAHDLFLAIKGSQADGRKYIADAIRLGACAVLVDTDSQTATVSWQQGIAVIPIYQLRQKIGLIAARFYDFPAKKLVMFAVTGTNGKTSCSHFLAHSLQMLGVSCGIMGTLGSGFYGQLTESELTTPNAIHLQAILQKFLQQGARAVAMEVSSHSIDQGRVNHIPYEIGIFTNLTQDHLDYHGDMATYASVKHQFLADWPIKHLIINADDAYGKQWINELAQRKSIYAYSIAKPTALPSNVPAIFAEQVQLSLQGIHANVHTPWGDSELVLPLIGQFNLSNALAVLTALCVQGRAFPQVLQCLSKLQTVPGRMQTAGGQGKPLIVVDYSHTPDSLENALHALRAHIQGKLHCVFGCGGNRDRSKRPLMAKIAEQYADTVIVTNDNPRYEKPEDIVKEILRGFSSPEHISVELDRSKAIKNSIQLASRDDCVLIAGKGAETYQQIGDEKLPFDDMQQVLTYLNGR